jgi:predicted AlkP superfamily pyrophosphatase or phosphodiesterase
MTVSGRVTRRTAWTGTIGVLLGLTTGSAGHAQGRDNFAEMVRLGKRPRLTVGFRYLMAQGSYFTDCRYEHFPTYTGPGHAALLTGSAPYKNGIISNDWWDKATLSPVYCVDDPSVNVVGKVEGSVAKPMSAKNLRSTTVGDELKLATNGQAKVVSLAMKDRAAILMGGHNQDQCVWYDDYTGRWISSTAFCRDGKLPSWAEESNADDPTGKALGTVWEPTAPPEALQRSRAPKLPTTRQPYGMGGTFPHPIGKERVRNNIKAFTLTPAANAFVFGTAKRAILAEKLGQDTIPDLLNINLSTNDYAGHAFGPYSPELTDLTIATDKQLADFLGFLDKTVPGGLNEIVVVISGDHGVVPILENLREDSIPAERVLDAKIDEAVLTALNKAFGSRAWVGKDAAGKTVGGYLEPSVYLSEAAIAQALASGRASSRAQIEEVAANAAASVSGIYACYTRTQIMHNQLPQTDITRRIVRGFHPKLSGDLIVVADLQVLTEPSSIGPYSAPHGTPYVYDTHVPILISGPGIRSGVWADPVAPWDIAPTLCALLGVELPSACDGTILRSALK